MLVYIDQKMYFCKQEDMVGSSNYNNIMFLCGFCLSVFASVVMTYRYGFSSFWTVHVSRVDPTKNINCEKETLDMALDGNTLRDPLPVDT